jgi:DNA-binding NarL/FixJ family response regulator
MMNSYRIVLADDHVILRDGIKHIIQERPDLCVVGEASDGLELLRLLKRQATDMILLDISMKGLRGIEATREIKSSHPEIKIVILTMHKKRSYIQHALAAGADGYLLKESTGDELFDAITCVRSGGSYISKSLSKELTSQMLKVYRNGMKSQKGTLTVREKEILKLIAEGKSSKEIAELLFISIYTVNNHRANIIKKLKMKKTADLVKYAIQEGYTSDSYD